MNTEETNLENENSALSKSDVNGSLPFTDDELLNMVGIPRPNMLWERAFNFYNSDKKNYRLSMSCRNCYGEVMVYLLKIRLR